MMYFSRLTGMVFLVIGGISTTLVTGCGSMREEQKHAYRNAESINPIKMPAGLELTHSKESLEIPEQTATELKSVDELELPPKIIDSVDLKMLDSKDAKPAAKEKLAEKESSISQLESKTDEQVGTSEKKKDAPSIAMTKNSNGDSQLMVGGDFEKVWPLVKPALIELGFNIDDASRGERIYSISKVLPTLNLSDKPVHPGDVEPDVKEEYQIHVNSSGEKTQITIHNKLGQIEGSGLADHLLLQIKEIMENPKTVSNSNG